MSLRDGSDVKFLELEIVVEIMPELAMRSGENEGLSVQ